MGSAAFGFCLLVSVESFQKVCEVVGSELPLQGFGRFVVTDLEAGKALLDDAEVVRSSGDSGPPRPDFRR